MFTNIPPELIDTYQFKDINNETFRIVKVKNDAWILTKNIGLGNGVYITTDGYTIHKLQVQLSKEIENVEENRPHLPVFFQTAEVAYKLLCDLKITASIL